MNRFNFMNLRNAIIFAPLVILIPTFLSSNSHAESFDNLLNQKQNNFNSILKEAETEGKEKDKMMEEVWREKVREFDRLWEERRTEIEKKWEKALRSTNKEWVDYSSDDEARGIVNFEEGFVEISSIVPTNTPDIIKRGTEKIQEHFKKIFSGRNKTGENPLKNQIADSQGKIVSTDDVTAFTKKEIVKAITVAKKPVIAKDGVKRKMLTVRIDLLPSHLKIRAEAFIPPVSKFSVEIGVSPELIMAVIHTESYFNPLAESPAYAFGLMQLIPKYGARDAFKFLFKKDRIVDAAYLLSPKNNIRLGTAYLFILLYQIYRNINDPVKKNYISICAYNWGPTIVTRKIVKKNDINGMGRKELFGLLRRKTPKETSDYLYRVTNRMNIYKPMFN